MDSLTSLTSFVRTAETLSFVQAAGLLGISASAVGKCRPASINWGPAVQPQHQKRQPDGGGPHF